MENKRPLDPPDQSINAFGECQKDKRRVRAKDILSLPISLAKASSGSIARHRLRPSPASSLYVMVTVMVVA